MKDGAVTMSYTKINVEDLNNICIEVFKKLNFNEEESKIITDILLMADLYGIESHGVQRLMRYFNSIKQKTIHVSSKPEIVFETPISAVIDGQSGMGHLVANFANNLAIQKAKTVGMSFVSVRNSNHYGIAGYYTKKACEQGLIGISMTNTEAIAVPTNAKQVMLGSNPIAFAMPAKPYDFWFDVGTTVVTRGKLEVYSKANKPLELGWALGDDGKVSSDAANVLHCIGDRIGTGGILPLGGNTETMGGHKGYGFSMICEILCAITSGGTTSNHNVRRENQGAGTCHSFIVIDPKIFGDPETQQQRLSAFLEEVRSAKRADENIPIYTHGEKEMLRYEENIRDGVSVNIKTLDEITSICSDLGIDMSNISKKEVVSV